MKINWNYIKAVVLLGVVLFLVGFSHSKNRAKVVKDIAIEFEEGNTLFMDYQMVNKLLIQNGKTPKNEPKTIIDLHLLEANLLSHPMVENASVFLTVDGLLKARIKQRTPIARIVVGSNSYYIDKRAQKMPLSMNHSARVLLVTGEITDKDNAQIHYLVSTILNDAFLKKQIIGIEKVSNNQFVLRTRVGDQKIELGNLDNIKAKFKNLNSFYNKTMADNTIDNYTSINLKYNNQVVCTKK